MFLVDRATRELSQPIPWVHFQAPLSGEAIAPSVPDAMVTIMVASVWADGERTVEESARLTDLLSTSRLLRQSARESNQERVARATELLSRFGRQAALDACANAVPPDLRATAFANAVDVVFADGRVEEREKAYIDQLQAVLGIDDALAMKIVEVLAIKSRT